MEQQMGHADRILSLNQSTYEPEKCACLVSDFVHELRDKAKDNDSLFWRNIVDKFFARGAKYRLCVSKISAVSLEGRRCCDICGHDPACGIEVAVVPSIFRFQYETGTLEERWLLGRPKEYPNTSGQTILDYERAIQETSYENAHVVHEGQLRVVFAPDHKIYSWEFCVRQFEEFAPKSLIKPQLIQLGEAAQRLHSDARNISAFFPAQLMQDDYKRFLKSALELKDALESPLDPNFGYSKRYVQLLQYGETLAGECIKITMDHSMRTGASLIVSNSLPVEPVGALHHDPAVEEAGPATLGAPEGLGLPSQFQQSFEENMVSISSDPVTGEVVPAVDEEVNHNLPQIAPADDEEGIDQPQGLPAVDEEVNQPQIAPADEEENVQPQTQQGLRRSTRPRRTPRWTTEYDMCLDDCL